MPNSFTWTKGKLTKYVQGSILLGLSTYTYTYDAYGRRTSKIYRFTEGTQALAVYISSSSTNYTYDASGRLIREQYNENYNDFSSNSRDIFYLYDESGIIGAVQTYNGTTETFYFDRNILGDVVGIYNTAGTQIAKYSYDAWGNSRLTTLLSNNFSEYNPIRYRGYYFDVDTGLYYLNARYYNPQWRRFISPDSTEYLDPETPNGLNLYAYCYNDPVNRFDPSGHDWEWNSFLQGFGYLATGIGAIVAGALVIASGVATWPILLIAGVTIGAGALTTINGASEIVEAGTGYNFVEDAVFGGNSAAYNTYATITGIVATVGSIICGSWYKYNAPRIQAYKNISSYDYGKSAAKHVGERSYYDSTLLKKQIIKYGKMVNEGNGVFTFRIGGTSFNAITQLYHSGIWELTVINSMKLIGHFLLDY